MMRRRRSMSSSTLQPISRRISIILVLLMILGMTQCLKFTSNPFTFLPSNGILHIDSVPSTNKLTISD
jgi:hypothetical protein